MSNGNGPRSVIYDSEGDNPLIGQQAASGSLPVVLAPDQTPIPIASGSVTGLLVGGVPVSSANPLPITGSFTISAVFSGTLSSTITGSVALTEPITGSVGITGPVFVSNFPAVQTVTGSVKLTEPVTGTVGLSGPVAVSNFPVTQIITGSVGLSGPVTGTVGLSGPITGSVGITGPVTGSVGLTGPITGTVGLSGPVVVSNFPNPQIVSGSNWIPTITGSVGLSGPIAVTGLQGFLSSSIYGLSGSSQVQFATDAQGRIIVASAGTTASTAGFSKGDVTTAVIAVFSVRRTTYIEQTTDAQRSLVSTSVSDAAAGTGARTVQITYFNSTGVGPFVETVTLNGTTAVNTVATDICFIEEIRVMTVGSTLSNVGTISLKAATGGGGATIGTIAATDNQTFWCHHYVASGKTSHITSQWTGHTGTTVGSGCTNVIKFIPIGVANSVERTISDSFRLYGQSSSVQRSYGTAISVTGPGRLTTYVTPETSTSVNYRASFDFYED